MTIEELNDHLFILQQYHAAAERLESMRAVMLGAQKIDGMPHGTGVGDKTAALAIAIAGQEEDLAQMRKALDPSMDRVTQFCASIPDSLCKAVFRLRYLSGMTWAEVATAIGGSNNRDTVRQIVYRYLHSHETAQPSK